MVDNRRGNSFLIIAGFVILGVFVYVSVLNILPNNSSNSYFSKDNNFGASISRVTYNDGKLKVYVNDDNISVCVKQTKSRPDVNSMCWKGVSNGYVTVSVYNGRKYYIWLKNNVDNSISEYVDYKTDK